MTAPVQMTGSAPGSTIEPRGLRHSTDPTADIAATNEMPSADRSSETDSTQDSDSGDQSSFGSVLKKYFAPPNSGVRSSRNQQETGQQKKDSVAPDPLATVPVAPAAVSPRQVLPFGLSILPPDQNSTDAPSDSKGTEPAHHSEHTSSDLALLAPEPSTNAPISSSPLPSPLIPSPQVQAAQLQVAQVLAAQVLSSQLQATQAQAAASQAILAQTVLAQTEPQPAHVQAAQAQNAQTPAPQPDPLAFAVKLSPAQAEPQDEVVTKATDTASAHSQTGSQGSGQNTSQSTAQTATKETPTVDPAAAVAQASDPSADRAADRAAAINSMPLPAHAPATPSEPAPSSGKGDSHPVLLPAVAHIEPAASKPVEPSSSSRDFTVRIPDATDRGTNVRFVERGNEVHVSVRTADSDLAQLLRGGLNDLSGRLQHTGVQAEVWRPGSQTSNGDSQNASQNEPSDQRGSGGRRHQSGAQRDGQDQPSEDKPRWVEELESFGEPVLAKPY
jgi:hypothetical protein